MAKLDLFSNSGKSTGSMEASDKVFMAPENEHLVTEAVNWYLASCRQGSANAKTRAEVSGGGKKPWKQKGTGRARIGDNRAPHWRHGGVVFAPKPRDFSFSLPLKIRKAAIRTVLSDKARNGKLKVIDKIVLEKPKTKEMVKLLKSLSVASALIVIPDKDETINRVSLNIKYIKVSTGKALNVYDLLKHDAVIMTKEAVPVVEEALS